MTSQEMLFVPANKSIVVSAEMVHQGPAGTHGDRKLCHHISSHADFDDSRIQAFDIIIDIVEFSFAPNTKYRLCCELRLSSSHEMQWRTTTRQLLFTLFLAWFQ